MVGPSRSMKPKTSLAVIAAGVGAAVMVAAVAVMAIAAAVAVAGKLTDSPAFLTREFDRRAQNNGGCGQG